MCYLLVLLMVILPPLPRLLLAVRPVCKSQQPFSVLPTKAELDIAAAGVTLCVVFSKDFE
jgi:hypothetical protein